MVVNKFNHDAPWEARARFRRQRQRWSPPGSKLDLNRGISTLKSLALVGNASGRTLRKGLTLDPRRFRSRLATHSKCQPQSWRPSGAGDRETPFALIGSIRNP